MREITYTLKGEEKLLKLDVEDEELYEALKGFYNSKPAGLQNNDRIFKWLINKNGINTLKEYNENNITKLMEVASKKTYGEYVVINFFKFLYEKKAIPFKKYTLPLLKHKDFIKCLKKGYAITMFDPYNVYPMEDKWMIDYEPSIEKNMKKSIMMYDFSEINNPYIKDQFKNYIWYYPIDHHNKKLAYYQIKSFLKILDKNNDINAETVDVSLKDINEFKLSIMDAMSTSKSVYLNNVKSFLIFVDSNKVIKIKKGLYSYFSANDVKSKGDTRAYNIDQIEQMVYYLVNSNEYVSKLYSYILKVQYKSGLRPASIVNIKMEDIIEASKEIYVLDIHSKNEEPFCNINLEVKKLLEEVNEFTKANRERHNDTLSKYIFAFEAERRKTLTLPTTTQYSNNLNKVCKELGLPKFGQTGIRNHYQQKVTEMVINEGLNPETIVELSKHSFAVHMSNYDDYNRGHIRKELYNKYYNVEIGDIKVTGKIEKKLKYKTSQIVENGIGACEDEHCSNLSNMQCLSCPHFVTSPEELPLFENAVKELDAQIYNEDIQHEKEDLMTKKAIHVAYIAALEEFIDEQNNQDKNENNKLNNK